MTPPTQAAENQRDTFESQLARAARENPDAARQLAMLGGQRTLVEKAVWLYLNNREIIKDRCYKDYDPDGKKHLLATSRDVSILCRLFLKALDERDGATLRAIARAVEKHERNPARWNPLPLHILHIKDMVDQSGGTMTVEFLAKLFTAGQTGKFPTEPPTAALRAQVRRAAKRLDFPLAKRGRPKTIQNKG